MSEEEELQRALQARHQPFTQLEATTVAHRLISPAQPTIVLYVRS